MLILSVNTGLLNILRGVYLPCFYLFLPARHDFGAKLASVNYQFLTGSAEEKNDDEIKKAARVWQPSLKKYGRSVLAVARGQDAFCQCFSNE
jgi:hypothetical protein